MKKVVAIEVETDKIQERGINSGLPEWYKDQLAALAFAEPTP